MKILLFAFLAQEPEQVFTKFVETFESFDTRPEFRKQLYDKVYSLGEFCRTSEYNAVLRKRYDAFLEARSKDSLTVMVSKTLKVDDKTMRVEATEVWKRGEAETKVPVWGLVESIDGRWQVKEFSTDPFKDKVFYTSPKEEIKKDLSTSKTAAEACIEVLHRELMLPGDAKAAELKGWLEKLRSICSPSFVETLEKGFKTAVEKGRQGVEALKAKTKKVEEKEDKAIVECETERLILTKVKDQWLMSARQFKCDSCPESAKCQVCKGEGWLDY
jgi:hypothetical protein